LLATEHLTESGYDHLPQVGIFPEKNCNLLVAHYSILHK